MERRVCGCIIAVLVCACGDDRRVDPESEPQPESCAAGHVAAPGGGCMPVGIQGCAEAFVGDDGLCFPTADACPPGTIAKFDEGCIPVGIPACASAFVERDGSCNPSPDKCMAGTFPVPSEGCVPVDGDLGCGTGTWGNIADAPGTVWVDPSYTGGNGNGSMSMPVTSIAAAMALVAPQGRIALAAGDYAEPMTIDMPIEIVGRCPSMVTISGTQMTPYVFVPVIVLVDAADGARMSGLRISGDGLGVLVGGSTVELTNVHIDGATYHGLLAALATVTMRRCLVERTLSHPTNGGLGRGVEAQQAAQLTIEQSALVENHEVALEVGTLDTVAIVRDSVIAKTQPRASDDSHGRGTEVIAGASLELIASALLENHELAIEAAGLGTTVTVSDSLVARTLPRASDMRGGRGAEVQAGARLDLTGTALVDNHEGGLVAGLPGTTASLTACLVARTQPEQVGFTFGTGIQAQVGASVTLDGTTLLANHTAALVANSPGTTVTARSSLVAGTLPRASDQVEGRGISLQEGAYLALEGSAIVDNHTAGLSVIGLSPDLGQRATAHVTASVVAGTLPQQSDQAYGAGVITTGIADLSLTSSLVRGNTTAGVLVGGSANMLLAGALVEQVLPGKFHAYDETNNNQVIGTFEGIGDGIVVSFGSSATVQDTLVRGASRAGVLFHGAGGVLTTVHSTESRIGLVLQGSPKPEYSAATNVFAGTEQGIVTDGDLPVPEAPPLPTVAP